MNASLVVNPAAGNRAYKSISKIESLLRRHVSLITCITEKKGDAFNFANNINADRLIVAGGDGTINEVVNGIMASEKHESKKVPISLIPLGTTNVLAKEIGIPDTIDESVQIAINKKPHKISLGKINGKYFTLMAGAGFDGETVLGVNRKLIKFISGKTAHIISGINVLKKYNPPLICIRTLTNSYYGYNAIASNARYYGGYYSVTPDASITDPHLDVCILKGGKKMDLFRFIYRVIMKKRPDPDKVYFIQETEIEISSDKTVHVQIDGEYFGTLPVRISIVRNAVNFVW